MRTIVFSAIIVVAISAAACTDKTQVTVDGGAIKGVAENGITRFLGIPYAAAPIGELRWSAPQSVASWSGTKPADTFGPACQQLIDPKGFGPWSSEYVVHGEVSEDCLTVNVWTPAKSDKEKLPVLVWIHGGAFVMGAGSVPIYDGTELAKSGVIVVSMNYRLGAFGFAAFEELRDTPGGGTNFGFQDVIASLQWVQRNIAAFGGDPTRVTVAGQSAGGMVVHQLLLSPEADGLFAQAIPQSGLVEAPMPTVAEAGSRGDALKGAFKANSLTDLRKVPAQDILNYFVRTHFGTGEIYGPVIDNTYVFAGSVGQSTKNTPVMVGLTADEGVVMPDYTAITPDALNNKLVQRFGDAADKVRAIYAYDTPETAISQNKQIARDYGLASVIDWSTRWSDGGKRPVYAYYYTHTEPGPHAEMFGAFHSSEIPYAFGTLSKSPERPFKPIDFTISQKMLGYWSNFAIHGNPNGDDAGQWPQFISNTPQVFELGGAFAPHDISSDGVTLFREIIGAGAPRTIF